MGNNEVKRIANILFNMSLGMDYDTFTDDYKDDMEMLTESVGKLAKEDDPLYYVLQNIADDNAEMENKLVNTDGFICRQEMEIMNDKTYVIEMMMAIRFKYRQSSQNLSDLTKKLENVNLELMQAENYTKEMSYKQYKRLKEEAEELTEAIRIETIARNVWDDAREVCMNVVDDEN